MTANTVRLTFTGNEKDLERAFDRVGHSADRFGAGLSKLGLAAGAAGAAIGAAALKFGVDSVKAFMEAEKAQTQLQDAFERFPALADTNIKSLQKLNTELMKKTRFDDDATASGQAVLAQFRLTGTQLKTLTPLLQDYAAKTGKDLPDAAQDLGKAILGQGRALKAIGLDFQDTGSEAENFEQLVIGLRTQVGGFAEKEGQTAAGKLEILKNRFGEIQETVGAALLPILSTASDRLFALADEAAPRIRSFVDTELTDLTGALVNLKDNVLQGVKHGFDDIKLSVDSNAGSWRTLGDAITKIVNIAGPAVRWLVETIATAAGAAIDWVATLIGAIDWAIRRLDELRRLLTVTGTKPSSNPAPSIQAPGAGANWSNPSPKSFHSGGVVPGPPGTEVLSILQAGERVTPVGASDRIVLEIRSSGRDVDDFIAMIVSRVVTARGGNVQVAFGR